MSQSITNNGKVTLVYGKAQALAAGSKTVICAFDADTGVDGITLGLGISDPAAWGFAGTSFDLEVGGVVVLSAHDQIADLLRRIFIPIIINRADTVRLIYNNDISSPVVDVAATMVIS